MLAIDDMKRLAKMQELLLKRTSNDRDKNLEKYIDIIKQIDKYDFQELLSKINQVNEHNQTLEDEVQFLEEINNSYQQILEQQLLFKRNSELYGYTELELSDLETIDIEYVNDRISAINGYLITKKNISDNKEQLQDKNNELIKEEKNKELLKKRLLEFEESLRNNFINAEGRSVVDGKLQYISVVSEYKDLGYDIKELLSDKETLRVLLKKVNNEKIEIDEKLKTADICYNSMPSVESKQILDDITKENLSVKYKLTMLKILDLLILDTDEMELFRKKREDLLDLIKYRMNCLTKLGKYISIDPFARTRVLEQLEMVDSINDNSKKINLLKKEIAELSERLDDNISQNNRYMIQISDKRAIIISRTSINDIDISSISIDEEDKNDVLGKIILENQVIKVRSVPVQFNNQIVKQKTNSVIKRVSEMLNNVGNKKMDNSSDIAPELVIVPEIVSIVDDHIDNNDQKSEMVEKDSLEVDKIFNSSATSSLEEPPLNVLPLEKEGVVDNEVSKKETDESKIEKVTLEDVSNEDIFMNVLPFEPTSLFTDRSDMEEVEKSVKHEEIKEEKASFSDMTVLLDDKKKKIDLPDSMEELEAEMPEAFWVTQEEPVEQEKEISFDEQVNALLSGDSEVKSKKLVA